ncbi:MAG: hypothetical protein KF858_04215 [Candidatus Sumerlaeia bacterium]|nr:hypothetical protein [Candidatus Sumerlaeia bacterium]
MIGATGFDGLPAEGVAFSVAWSTDGGDVSETLLRTDAYGRLEAELPDSETVATVRLADERFRTPQGERVSQAGDRLLMFSLFRARVEEMSNAEREAFAQRWVEFATDSVDATPAHDVATPSRVAAFLEGTRREDAGAEPFVHPEDASTSAATLVVRVVTTQGTPSGNAIVYLFGYDETVDALRVAGSERTNARGIAVFRQVVPNRLHRAEARGENELTGRTGIVLTKPGQRHEPAPVVLRRHDEVLSGVVFDGDRPAAGTMVQVVGGRTPVKALTDQMGYFMLAPVRGDAQSLLIHRQTSAGSRMAYYPITQSGNEAMIPFHLVSRAGSPAP